MSSTYRILCLDHEPALTLDRDYQSAPSAEADLVDGIEGHETCDLMIGRYSAPLVELGCPRWRQGQPSPCHHSGPEWADVEWLRLLALAQQEPEGSSIHAAASASGLRCWSPRRLQRLSAELGMSITDRLTALLPPDMREAGAYFAWVNAEPEADAEAVREDLRVFLRTYVAEAFDYPLAAAGPGPVPETLRGPNWPADNTLKGR